MRTFIITLLLIGFWGELPSQKSVLLRHTWEPNTTYSTSMQMDMDMDMLLAFSEAMRADMGGAGMPDSMKMNMLMDMDMTNITGEVNNGELPFVIGYEKVQTRSSMNGEDIEMPEGANNSLLNMLVVGRFVNERMQIDSVSGEAVDSLMSENLKGNLQGMQSFINFPDKAMMPGDTFSQVVENTLAAGMAGSIKVFIRQHYTLERIENGQAYFKVTDRYLLENPDEPGAWTIGEARGNGTLEFDVTGGFVKVYRSKMYMQMEMQMPGTDGKMQMRSQIDVVMTTVMNP